MKSKCNFAETPKGHFLRCLLDEIFGGENVRNEITWKYVKYQMGGIKQFVDNTDRLYWYSKGDTWAYNLQMEPLQTPKELLAKGWDKEKSVIVNLRNAEGRTYKITINEEKVDDFWDLPFDGPIHTRTEDGGILTLKQVPADNVWLFPYIAAPSYERTGYPTQKPDILLQRVLKALSNPGDIVLDCFVGSGTTTAVAQKLGRRWIGCDINKGAIQLTAKRLQGVIHEQVEQARKDDAKSRQGKLIGAGEPQNEEAPEPAQLAFTVWRVNDYDLAIQHNEAVNLACEHIGIERTRSDAYFDGTLGGSLAKIIPFGHPLTPLDLEELRRELDARPEEDRPVTIVCLGIELAARAWVEDWNRLRKGKDAVNRISVIELRTDERYGKFIRYEPARAKVKVRRKHDEIAIEIEDFISPTILERLEQQAGLVKPKIDDWRAMVDCVMIDPAYDGNVFNVVVSDVPGKKTDLVQGRYELPGRNAQTTVAVKIIDMLGEEVLVVAQV